MNVLKLMLFLSILLFAVSCKDDTPDTPEQFYLVNAIVNGNSNGFTFSNLNTTPDIKLNFSAPLDRKSVESYLSLISASGNQTFTVNFENNDSSISIIPTKSFNYLSRYTLFVLKNLVSKKQTLLGSDYKIILFTAMDTTDKFPKISDDNLLELIQKNTFSYFWDFGHPVSGLARERNNSGDLVTSGGSGFGVMAILVGIHRNFITKQEGLDRLLTIADFLQKKADKYHGAFPHWLNGNTGKIIPFSSKDNGADLVETAYLLEGLLTAREFFNSSSDANEILLRQKITSIWENVEWDWFRKNNENALYWHWSSTDGWAMNMKVQGWNEALIVYVLAASSPTHSIEKPVYENGWALNGSIKLNKKFYGFNLPLGWDYGGPLFFAHYSFLGLDPRNLIDQYANYWEQNVNHSKINYSYCVTNPNGNAGYNANCWGLTASDIPNGYTASSPTNDKGVIAPTAAVSSLPYTPIESMQAIRFFYYKMGDKIWGQYGFKDAFSFRDVWFADSYLAIDQGPQICMIENYRTGLLWNLFMSAPEVQAGLTKLGFSYR